MELYHIIVAISIFVVIYTFIISEKINRMTIAIVGAVLLLLFKIMTQEEAIATIDFNTIGLLIGMMIIVNILRRTGAFEYMAIKAAKMVKGEPWKILVAFAILTAVASALLDNVTTILLIVPVTLVITETLELNPVLFVLPLVLASNIGGTATLIGDPPNIMIGSASGLGFVDFIVNLAPIIIVIFVVVIFLFRFKYKKTMTNHRRQALEDHADERKSCDQRQGVIEEKPDRTGADYRRVCAASVLCVRIGHGGTVRRGAAAADQQNGPGRDITRYRMADDLLLYLAVYFGGRIGSGRCHQYPCDRAFKPDRWESADDGHINIVGVGDTVLVP